MTPPVSGNSETDCCISSNLHSDLISDNVQTEIMKEEEPENGRCYVLLFVSVPSEHKNSWGLKRPLYCIAG